MRNSALLLYLKIWQMYIKTKQENKRAQRALGRSPENKVKGRSGAIYRGPLTNVAHQILVKDL